MVEDCHQIEVILHVLERSTDMDKAIETIRLKIYFQVGNLTVFKFDVKLRYIESITKI